MITDFNIGTLSKSDLAAKAEEAANTLVVGTFLDALVEVKAAQEYLSSLESAIRPKAQEEAEFQGLSESLKSAGVKIALKNGPTTYDYEADAEYEYLATQVKLAKDKLDARKKILDLATASPAKVAVDENGVVVPAPPVLKEGSKVVAITLPK